MPKSKDTTSKSLKDTIASIDDHFGKGTVTVSYTHLTLPTNREV